ncbi:DUF2892 domain-containing protein [Bacillus sp. FJAT-47783]|uniref:YgaP family membrane protein n=1 Tax=Bacillus sp. FJAT-47783 TaxID=2922712 RepID=UPI001FAC680D|nr:DUF2892 domain-containing protein [Bacillus sp. FJAT-47783]
MLRPNIGIVNALLRITFGLTALCWACSKYIKMPWRDSLLLVIMCAAMKVGEGILRFCPITFMFECYMEDDEDLDEEDMAFNPS